MPCPGFEQIEEKVKPGRKIRDDVICVVKDEGGDRPCVLGFRARDACLATWKNLWVEMD